MNILLLEKLSDGRLIINLRQCGKCRQNLIELFQLTLPGQISYESLLFDIYQDKNKNMKINYDGFKIMCPSCKDEDKNKNITWIQASEEDLKVLNGTSLSQTWVTRDDI